MVLEALVLILSERVVFLVVEVNQVFVAELLQVQGGKILVNHLAMASNVLPISR
jgi:hypothetical protein